MNQPTGAGVSAPVITLFETYGCGARDLGVRLAARLGVPYFDQRFSSDDLADAEADQGEPSGPWAALLRVFAGAGEVLDNAGQVLYHSADDEIVAENNAFVRSQAATGGVFLGRSATVVLRARPNTLHVKLDAPVGVRIARAVAGGLAPDEARAVQEREDRTRAELSRRLYNWDPRGTAGFDLVLNVDAFAPDVCERIILDALAAKRSA